MRGPRPRGLSELLMRRVTRSRHGFSIGRFSSESTLKRSPQRGRAIRGTHVRGRTIQIMMGQIETPDIRWSALTAPPADPAEKAFDPDTFFRVVTQDIDPEGGTLKAFMPRWGPFAVLRCLRGRATGGGEVQRR